MDGHWCPQVYLTQPAVLRYAHIIRLENLEGDLRDALSDIFGDHGRLGVEQGHRTNAAAKLSEYYDRETIDLVRLIYGDDFIAFRYDRDLESAFRIPELDLHPTAVPDIRVFRGHPPIPRPRGRYHG